MKFFIKIVLILLLVSTPAIATPAPAKKKPVASAQKKSATVSSVKYKVRKGDSLYSIARARGMKVAELKRLNNLRSDALKPGQMLIVRGTGKKSAEEEAPRLIAPTRSELADIDDALTGEAGIEPIARTYLSIPYRYGAQSRRSTDCSGFVQQVFREFDISLPRTAREQYTVGKKIVSDELQSGDLLFFRTRSKKKYPTHVGIYLGNGKMIHASSRQHKVVISDVNHPYYVKRYVGAKRAATFLPGEVDLAMLARQVGDLEGFVGDTPLGVAADAEVGEEVEIVTAQGATGESREVVMEAGYDDDSVPDDTVDDIDGEVEPEPEPVMIVSPLVQPAIGQCLPPSPVSAPTEVAALAVTPIEPALVPLPESVPAPASVPVQ